MARYDGATVEALADGYDLHLITNRTVLHTKSRTIGNYWLTQLMPENGVVVSASDAQRLGLREGDRVKVASATNPQGVWDLGPGDRKPMVAKVIVTEGIRPGVVTFVLGYGRWATGAVDVVIDGQVIKGDPRRATGVHANAAMWADPSLRGTTCLMDPVGGSVSFHDTRVRLVKV